MNSQPGTNASDAGRPSIVAVLSRTEAGRLDVVLGVANPTPQSIEVARRAADTCVAREICALVVANRVANDEDLAPIDLDDGSPGVRAISDRVAAEAVVQAA